MFIEQPSKWLRWMYPKALWRMDPQEKAVYLTFDDGPIPEATPFILDTLAKYGIKATFFMVGDNAASTLNCTSASLTRDIESATIRTTTWVACAILSTSIATM